ncbi:phage tail protein [Geobacter sp. SVR]|uniref:phage tail protein n=1 Tax=Geobacter sp. SVR TaxID=2495594 RepID=UPI00143F04D3|nr:phage tail protein [Geobacter sp. SVR]BCS54571.1 hypothetical protein GSVR_28790 [Geobacter sp. SVR]GCF86922.1 hypothetical protein GSbR_35220 [Geobacter sp. SVR]
MGRFWAYFRDTLRLPFIQLPGALAMLAEGSAELLDTARGLIVTLRDQYLAERCEAALLAHFARSRGIVRVQQEPEAHWIGRVRLAYLWHIRGGRAGALRQVLLAYYGFADVRVINLRGEDPERWAEFRVECELIGSEPLFSQTQVEWAINEIKPARSKLSEVLFVQSVIGDVPCYSFALISTEIVTVFPEAESVTGERLFDELDGAMLSDELDGEQLIE